MSLETKAFEFLLHLITSSPARICNKEEIFVLWSKVVKGLERSRNVMVALPLE